jgi:hypothetical protein
MSTTASAAPHQGTSSRRGLAPVINQLGRQAAPQPPARPIRAGGLVNAVKKRRKCTGRYRRLSASQKEVCTAHARMRGPGERANAEIKNRRIRRKIRFSPSGHPPWSKRFRH